MSAIQANNKTPEFQEDPPRVAESEPQAADTLLLDIEGYEGPIDVLLELARSQKVDLTKISILQLARQYLGFVERAKAMRLDLAAEYLVMAAWLAYLKSRLLLPCDAESDEPSADEMAEALQFQLRRLEAMQQVGKKLLELPRLGQSVFPRGAPEGLPVHMTARWQVTFYDVLKAYGDIQRRKDNSHYDLPDFNLMSAEDALGRMTRMLGQLPRKGMSSVWTTLRSFLPDGIADRLFGRSALSSMLSVSLEMAKQGKLEIRQDGLFKPIYVRESYEDS